MQTLITISIYTLAAIAEIAGCFAFWAWFRLDKSAYWIAPGVLSLMLFAWLLTKVDVDFAGRAYAAYGGVYIIASLFWLWAIEDQSPSRWDIIGAALCFAGICTILFNGLSK